MSIFESAIGAATFLHGRNPGETSTQVTETKCGALALASLVDRRIDTCRPLL
jgi:hypothetical protein